MIRFQIVALLLALTACSPTVPARAPDVLAQASFLFNLEPEPLACPADGHLMLTGVIDPESSDAFVRQLEACRGRRVAVEINSPGGSVFASMAIQKAIEHHDRPVMCVVDGLAASAAFVTLQSCTSRYMTDRSLLMAHHAAITGEGQANVMKNLAEALRAINWGMVEHCAKRMGMRHDDFEERVADGREWYFSQADAEMFHAIDGPAESVDEIVKLAAE